MRVITMAEFDQLSKVQRTRTGKLSKLKAYITEKIKIGDLAKSKPVLVNSSDIGEEYLHPADIVKLRKECGYNVIVTAKAEGEKSNYQITEIGIAL